MKKQISVAVMAVTLVALIAVGGTLAFYTTEATVTNQITTGKVAITLTEPDFSSATGGDLHLGHVVPGQQIVKDPTITNDDKPCYVRAKVELTMQKDGQPVSTVSLPNGDTHVIRAEDFFTPNTGWAKSGDYYYFNAPLSEGAQVELFKTIEGTDGATVEIPAAWGNEIADATISLNISAEAIQADGFTPTTSGGTITGWNYSNGGGSVPVIPSSSAIPMT